MNRYIFVALLLGLCFAYLAKMPGTGAGFAFRSVLFVAAMMGAAVVGG